MPPKSRADATTEIAPQRKAIKERGRELKSAINCDPLGSDAEIGVAGTPTAGRVTVGPASGLRWLPLRRPPVQAFRTIPERLSVVFAASSGLWLGGAFAKYRTHHGSVAGRRRQNHAHPRTQKCGLAELCVP